MFNSWQVTNQHILSEWYEHLTRSNDAVFIFFFISNHFFQQEVTNNKKPHIFAFKISRLILVHFIFFQCHIFFFHFFTIPFWYESNYFHLLYFEQSFFIPFILASPLLFSMYLILHLIWYESPSPSLPFYL